MCLEEFLLTSQLGLGYRSDLYLKYITNKDDNIIQVCSMNIMNIINLHESEIFYLYVQYGMFYFYYPSFCINNKSNNFVFKERMYKTALKEMGTPENIKTAVFAVVSFTLPETIFLSMDIQELWHNVRSVCLLQKLSGNGLC